MGKKIIGNWTTENKHYLVLLWIKLIPLVFFLVGRPLQLFPKWIQYLVAFRGKIKNHPYLISCGAYPSGVSFAGNINCLRQTVALLMLPITDDKLSAIVKLCYGISYPDLRSTAGQEFRLHTDSGVFSIDSCQTNAACQGTCSRFILTMFRALTHSPGSDGPRHHAPAEVQTDPPSDKDISSWIYMHR